MKTSNIGSTERVAPAISSPQSVLYWPTMPATPTGSVLSFELLMITKGHRKSFQVARKMKTARVARAGFARGRMSSSLRLHFQVSDSPVKSLLSTLF